MAKMSTIVKSCVGTCHLDDHNERSNAERNLFAVDVAGTWEALEFCRRIR